MREENIELENLTLHGYLELPPEAKGIVLFAHGSGSGRRSPRNQYVAKILREGGLGTLLMDLLTPAEEQEDEYTRQYRFDIPLLASRLVDTTDWLKKKHLLPQGYFGSSTGAAAALIGAAKRPQEIKAVVSRGGRTDLAEPFLNQVEAPTLMIVGSEDEIVLELNASSQKKMHSSTQLEIISQATHLFEESGALEQVALLARNWFIKYLI